MSDEPLDAPEPDDLSRYMIPGGFEVTGKIDVSFEPLIYNPEPVKLCEREPGVGSGWVVIHNGKPGPARMAEAVMATDPDGDGFLEITGEWRDVEVTDD